jgi:hypothetical protein
MNAVMLPYHIQDVAIAYHLEERRLEHGLATEIDYAPSHPRKLPVSNGE